MRPSYDGRPGLLYYHYGAPVSTAVEYDGLDIRAEVVILSRNIKIMGGDHVMQDIWRNVTEEQVVDGKTITVDKEVIVETRRQDTTNWGA